MNAKPCANAPVWAPDDAISVERVGELTESFSADRANRVARNAVTSSDVNKAARNPCAMRAYRDTYSVSIKRAGKVCNQRQTGRCWLFTTYNVARSAAMATLDVDDLELSQSFGMFYDKLEKANATLLRVCETADRPADDREVAWLLDGAAGDGGEFRYGANLIAKYGVVPSYAMPETACSKNSSQMNARLARLLRRDAAALRRKAAAGATRRELDALRREMLAEVHRVLCVCLGEPPATFDLTLEVGPRASVDESLLVECAPAERTNAHDAPAEKDREADDADRPRRLLVDRGITPVEFERRYVRFDGTSHVEMCSIPGDVVEQGHVYGVRLMDTVAGGERWRLLNTTPDVLEDACVASLRAGVPCYMACDVSQELGRDLEDFPGVLGLGTMEYDSLFGVDFSMSRTEMFETRETAYTHAMTFVGVELGQDGRPAAWRVQNSWGKDACKDGYLIMGADWFRAYGEYAVVERRFVEGSGHADALAPWDAGEICEQDPWGPMGSAFARARA